MKLYTKNKDFTLLLVPSDFVRKTENFKSINNIF